MKKKTIKEYKRTKASIDPKIKTKWEKQNNSNKYMSSAGIQIQSEMLQWKESELKKCGQEIKENNDNVWSITSEERCGQIVH